MLPNLFLSPRPGLAHNPATHFPISQEPEVGLSLNQDEAIELIEFYKPLSFGGTHYAKTCAFHALNSWPGAAYYLPSRSRLIRSFLLGFQKAPRALPYHF